MTDKLEVHCTISNCHYWAQGNRCDANEILVTSDSLAGREPDRVDAPVASRLEATPARKCEETCCKTFVSEGSGKERADSVYRV